MPSGNLTLRQIATLVAIRNYSHLNGHPPCVRELAALLNVSKGTVHQRLKSLQRKGCIVKKPRLHRAIEILPPKPRKPTETDDELTATLDNH
jgi:DNA-binding MarR family transcriptional regulator